MNHFKWSPILKPIGLYKPAERVREMCINTAKKLKVHIYCRCLRKHRQRQNSDSKKQSILIFANGGIGNAVEATPLIQAVRIHWPNSNITLLTSPGDLFYQWCVLDKIVHSIHDIKGEKFDHTFFTYSTHWHITAPIKASSYGKVHKPKQYFDERFLKPEREYNMDMVRRLGFKGPAPALYVSLKEKNDVLTDTAMQICFVPGGRNEPRWKNKRWPYYSQLAEIIVEKYPNSTIYLIGTKEDEVDQSLLAASYVKDVRGKLTLRETAWILKKVNLVIGNDCGPIHIADAAGAVGTVLFGPSCDLKNSPRNKIVSVYVDMPCRPCQYNGPITCKAPKCIQEITPLAVMETIKEFI